MAGRGQLPTYQALNTRYVNGFPVSPLNRRTLRAKEKYLIFIVFVVFGVVCYGGMFLLPEMRNGVSVVRTIRQPGGPADLFLPPPPIQRHNDDNYSLITNRLIMRHNGLDDVDPHILEDKVKLKMKIDHDIENDRLQNLKNRQVLERPKVQDSNSNIWGSGNSLKAHTDEQTVLSKKEKDIKEKELSNKLESDDTIIKDHQGGPGGQGGDPIDADIKEKREKIKQVGR